MVTVNQAYIFHKICLFLIKKKKKVSKLKVYFILGPKETEWNYTLHGIPKTILQGLIVTN